MLGKTGKTIVLLITDSEVQETAYHYGYIYSLISQEDYLNSNAAALKADSVCLLIPRVQTQRIHIMDEKLTIDSLEKNLRTDYVRLGDVQ